MVVTIGISLIQLLKHMIVVMFFVEKLIIIQMDFLMSLLLKQIVLEIHFGQEL